MREILLQQARAEYGPLLDLSEPYHRNYARGHGLEYMRVDRPIVAKWPGYWDSVGLFIGLLRQGCERIFWLDADALIITDQDIRQGMSDRALTMARHPNPAHWNCGVLFIRRGSGALPFFEIVLARGPGTYPHYQQAIMNDLLETREWRGLVGRLDDRWNSTIGHVEADDPAILAWHGTPGPANKYNAMRAAINELEHARDCTT